MKVNGEPTGYTITNVLMETGALALSENAQFQFSQTFDTFDTRDSNSQHVYKILHIINEELINLMP